jgi:hypothetical protein
MAVERQPRPGIGGGFSKRAALTGVQLVSSPFYDSCFFLLQLVIIFRNELADLFAIQEQPVPLLFV